MYEPLQEPFPKLLQRRYPKQEQEVLEDHLFLGIHVASEGPNGEPRPAVYLAQVLRER